MKNHNYDIDNMIENNKILITLNLLGAYIHDMKNLMNSLNLSCHRLNLKLKYKATDKDGFQEEFSQICKTVEELEFQFEIVSEKYKSLNQSEIREEINIRHEILKCMEICRFNKKVSYSINSDFDFTIMGSRNRFITVILNIILNSIDATNEHNNINSPHIRIELSAQKTIKIIDNGIGFGNHKVEDLFNPYFTTKTDKSGMGLPISKIIMEKYFNGNIKIERIQDKTEVTLKFETDGKKED
jgi:nitrogen fixation/metabolism regulation signal transduction histidine kinase